MIVVRGVIVHRILGKVEKDQPKRNTKTLHQQVMSKLERRHQARQRQQTKHRDHVKSTSVFSGHAGAPRIVAIVPLARDGNATLAIQQLNKSLDLDDVPTQGQSTFRIERFKQSIQYLPTEKNFFATLDACKIADFVIFLLSPEEEVDVHGEMLIRAIESQGLSTVFTVVQGLDEVEPAKKRPQILQSLKSYITHFLPGQERVYSLDAHQECANLVRSLCTTTPRGVRWREDRSYMVVDELERDETTGNLAVTGVVRGRGLKANRLVQLGDHGTFQVDKITSVPLLNAKKRKADEMMTLDEASAELDAPDANQDDLADLAPEEIDMRDADITVSEAPTEKRGVLLDDHHYFSDDETHLPEKPKKLPKGTSAYQAAWFLGDMSDSGSDYEDEANEQDDVEMEPALPQDGLEGLDKATIRDLTEAAPSEYPQSEMFLDPSPNDEAEELEAYRSSRKNEANEDAEFPDEIELHPNVLARERLARYRGLKSLRTSKWETSEDRAHEPEEWNRLLRVADYKAARSLATREALVGGIQPGTRVTVYIRNVPATIKLEVNSSRPLTLFSLLRHEHKKTVMNFAMTLSSDHPTPIKAKEELILQCGPRRLAINPVFSQAANTPNNVHKFDRYIHPGRTAMATFMGPVTWGAVPALFFKRRTTEDGEVTSELELVGTGTSQAPDHSRVIAKRVILTGHPYKIHKKLVTVRYMFFNKEDVDWFKALQLWTKRGRSGFIKESLGTHGYFKATFDAKINPQDSIGVSLYKRVFPRSSKPWFPTGKQSVTEDTDMVKVSRS
jgi:pre-rRNA-processing protein TSR1